jgi:hypothetical protein
MKNSPPKLSSTGADANVHPTSHDMARFDGLLKRR